ncbi:unnamed protein product [Paramecium pentaurelia]|uniref:Uncharacterized protein n=1 Tax=Paramecium pentaurelia TaxID=43138 RepID=A0A8S1X0N1_9CILI|nr:unnamed protein product [Paramecium pentaurelia]
MSYKWRLARNDLIKNQIELFLFLTKTSFEIAPIIVKKIKGIISSIIKQALILSYLNHYLRQPAYFTKCKIFQKSQNNIKFFIKSICCYGRQQIIIKKKNIKVYKRQFYN